MDRFGRSMALPCVCNPRACSRSANDERAKHDAAQVFAIGTCIRRPGHDRPPVRSRSQRRPGALAESGRLRPQGHRHRLPASPTASRSMSKPGTSTGPTWAFPTGTTAPSNAPTSTGGIARRSFPQGGTFTPKQLQLEKENGKLYWCDREGMRVMRCNLDGSNIETLVDTSHGDPPTGPDATKWCVGIAVDPERGHIYWTQKGPDDAGTRPHLSREHRNPEGRDRGQSHRHRSAVRRLARADRPGARSQEPRSCTGPTAAIRRAATRSTAPRWTRIPGRGRPRRFCTST